MPDFGRSKPEVLSFFCYKIFTVSKDTLGLLSLAWTDVESNCVSMSLQIRKVTDINKVR